MSVRARCAAQAGFAAWNATPVEARAAALERAADLSEQNRAAADRAAAGRRRQDARRCARRGARGGRLLPLLRRAGAHARLRRSRCRGRPARPTICTHRGRGVFVCISPWNFPLAIFTGQVAAALVAGNAVVAKPAEQTPLIAARGGAPAARGRRAADRAASRARATARSARRWSPMRASRASRSPARPRSRARSIARSPPRTGRSCR